MPDFSRIYQPSLRSDPVFMSTPGRDAASGSRWYPNTKPEVKKPTLKLVPKEPS